MVPKWPLLDVRCSIEVMLAMLLGHVPFFIDILEYSNKF